MNRLKRNPTRSASPESRERSAHAQRAGSAFSTDAAENAQIGFCKTDGCRNSAMIVTIILSYIATLFQRAQSGSCGSILCILARRGCVRVPRSVCHRRASLDFPRHPRVTNALQRTWISRFPREVAMYVHRVFNRAGLSGSAPQIRPSVCSYSGGVSEGATHAAGYPARTIPEPLFGAASPDSGRSGSLLHFRMISALTTPLRFSRRTGA